MMPLSAGREGGGKVRRVGPARGGLRGEPRSVGSHPSKESDAAKRGSPAFGPESFPGPTARPDPKPPIEAARCH